MKIPAATFGLAGLLALVPQNQDPAQAATGGSEKMVEITRGGSRRPTRGAAENFTGAVRVDPLFAVRPPARGSGASVTFEPGARTAWHTHPAGQVLIVTSGSGLVQQWGAPVEEIRPGDVVWTPPDVKHWHGATQDTAMTHIAIQESLDGKVVEWLEKVSDEQYGAQRATARAAHHPRPNVPRETNAMKVRLTVNGRELTVTLNNSETARDFVSLLPLTLTMNDLFGREKFARLPRVISEEGRRSRTYEVGAIAYWPPGPDVAIFYRHDGQSIPDPGIIVIGKIESGVEALSAHGTARVKVERLKQGMRVEIPGE